MRFLDAEHLLALHDALLRRWGGEEGSGHRGAAYEGADAAAQAVKNSYYDSVEDLAAAYAVYVVQGHVFLDGNKRTGAAAMLVFLALNRAPGQPPPLEVAEKMVELQVRSESGERSGPLVARLADWLRSHRTPQRRRKRRGPRRKPGK
jgi:death-on-curing protein